MADQGDGTVVPGASPGPLTPVLDLVSAQQSIEAELHRHPQLIGFLPAAEAQLVAASLEFLEKLGAESVKAAASRPGATAVDQGDVTASNAKLSTSTQVQSWLLGLAGLLGGAGASLGIAIGLTPPEHAPIWWVAFGILLLAAVVLFMVARPKKA